MDNKGKLISILIAAILGLLVLVGALISAHRSNNNTIDQLNNVVLEQLDSTSHYKNKYGNEVAEKRAVEAKLDLIKLAYANDVREIKKQLDINTKDIKGIYKAVTTTTGTGEGNVDTVTVIKEGIPVKALSVYDSTKWFTISGLALYKKFIYNYEVRDSITLVPYREGKMLFVRGISANPNTRITGLQGILVATDPKPKRWSIGPSIQIGYDSQIRIIPGISIQYSLIRF